MIENFLTEPDAAGCQIIGLILLVCVGWCELEGARVSATAIIELFERGEGFLLSQWRVQFPGVFGS